MEGAKVSLNSTWQNFLNENLEEKTIFTYIQGLEEIISNLKPRTMTERRRMSLARQHLREVKRYARRMQNEMQVLEEQLNILEESKEG
jgi:ribosomal protein S7